MVMGDTQFNPIRSYIVRDGNGAGQREITIPKFWLAMHGIKPGDELSVFVAEDASALVIIPTKKVKEN